jgi:hypothetical protein
MGVVGSPDDIVCVMVNVVPVLEKIDGGGGDEAFSLPVAG